MRGPRNRSGAESGRRSPADRLNEFNRAVSVMRSGDFETAANHLQALAREDPTNHLVHANLGSCAMRMGQFDRARSSLRTSLRVRPLADTYMMLFLLEQAAGDAEAAMTAIEAGERLAHDPMQFISARAGLLHSQGEYEKAITLLEPAMVEKPDDPSLIAIFVKLVMATDRAEVAIPLLEQSAVSNTAPAARRAASYTTLGKAYEQAGRYDDAFLAYEKSNDLQPHRYDDAENDRLIDELVKAWTPEVVERLSSTRTNDTTPIPIVGMPRSGTSLIEQIIGSHPDAHAGGELGLLPGVIEEYQVSQGYRAPALLSTSEINSNGLNRLLRKYLRDLRKLAPQAAWITDKLPSNYLHLGAMYGAMPGVRAVHCVRDPLDTALSCYFQNFGPTAPWSRDPEHIAHFFKGYRRVIDHWESLFPARTLEVSYEGLIESPEEGIRSIIDRLGLVWDDRCLEFHKEKRLVSTASQDQVRKPIYRTASAKASRFGEHAEPFARALREIAGVDA